MKAPVVGAADTTRASRALDPRPAYDVAALRTAEFPWAGASGPYLNNASTGPLPRRTVVALAEFNELRSQPHLISQEMQFGVLDRSRELCARLVGAAAGEISLMVNTGYGINLASRALNLTSGDLVLSVEREFPANVYPWMALERGGVEVRRLPCVNGVPDEDALVRAIASETRLRAVTISWVAFASGYTFDLERVGSVCEKRGVHLVVDAIQGVGARPLDLAGGRVSILACGAQKWLLSPWGTGFAYIRADLARKLEPSQVSWMAVRGADDFTNLVNYDLTWRDNARRFEMVTLPFQDFAGMNASLELLLSLGGEMYEHIAGLAERIADRARSSDAVTGVMPVEAARRAGIVSVVPRDAAQASRRLDEVRAIYSLREGAIRLSPHCYNTVEEVDLAMDALSG